MAARKALTLHISCMHEKIMMARYLFIKVLFCRRKQHKNEEAECIHSTESSPVVCFTPPRCIYYCVAAICVHVTHCIAL